MRVGLMLIIEFQSTPSRRGRRFLSGYVSVFRLCFNPLPHAEGDAAPSASPQIPDQVSIHSLTQRETLLCSRSNQRFENCFNPLPHAEGDRVSQAENVANEVVLEYK